MKAVDAVFRWFARGFITVGVLKLFASIWDPYSRAGIGIALLVVGIILLAIANAARGVSTPGEKLHGQVLHAESAWWRASPGLRFAVFASGVWIIGGLIFSGPGGPTFGAVLLPPIAIMAVYWGFGALVVGPTPEQRQQRVLEHLATIHEREVAAENEAVEKAASVTSLTPEQRRRAMDELIGRMK